MQYETKTIKRKSPLNELSNADLKELVSWKVSKSYEILDKSMREAELIYSRDALMLGELKENEFIRMSERFKTYRSILGLPDLAIKILEKRGKEEKEKTR